MARSSVYSRALSLPDWVLGGEYGDIAKTLNSREQSYEQLQAQEQVNDQRQIALDKAEEQAAFEDALSERFGENRPTSMRDAYEQMINLAYETGNPLSALEYQSKLTNYEQTETGRRRKDLVDALNLADNTTYDRLTEMFPDVGLTPEEFAKNQRRVSSGARKEQQYMMMDEDGVVHLVPESDFNNKAQLNWKPYRGSAKSEDPFNELINQALTGAAQDSEGVPGAKEVQAQKGLVENIRKDAREIAKEGRARISSGDIAPSDMRIRNPQTGEVVVVRKGQQIP